MNFLLPMAAWLGILAAPIIAFYLLKTRQRRKQVSTLLFWNQLKPKMENSPFWRKLRRWVSLLLQLLVFALILLGLMRPAFDWEQKAPRRIVAVLDNSASMQAETPSHWEEAVQRLERSIAQLRVQDEMAILTAENPPRILQGWTSSKSDLREALKGAQVLTTGADPSAALALASELVALRENGLVEIYSDAVWPEPAKEQLKPEAAVLGVESAKPENTGLTLFAIRRSPVAPGDWQLDAEVTSPTAFSGTLELRRDGQPMDLTSLQGEAGKPWRKTWRGSSESGAVFEGVLQFSGKDWLALDNQATAKLAPLAQLQVLLVGKDDPFLEAVMSSIPLVEYSRAEQFPEDPPANLDLIIATGDAVPKKPIQSALLLLNPAVGGFWGELNGTLEDAPISDVSKKSPLARHAGLNQVAVESAGKWKPAEGSDVLVSSLEQPLVFGQWDRTPRWLVVGFDAGKSDLPFRTAFPVFMGNLLESLRSETGTEGAATLPGRVETEFQPVAPGTETNLTASWLPVFPGWWWVLLAGLAFLVLEWALFNRRITD